MTKSDFAEWKNHPVTREVFQAWKERRNELNDQLPSDVLYGGSIDSIKTAVAVRIYDEILGMEFTDGN